jgi:hypothetical protein
MSADYAGPPSIDRSIVTRQVKRAHPLIDRNAIYPMIPANWRAVNGCQAGTCRVAGGIPQSAQLANQGAYVGELPSIIFDGHPKRD